MSLGSRINEIRRDKKISIDELCEKSGVPKGTLSKITAGITTSPTLDTVKAIAKALECKLDDLDDDVTPVRIYSPLEQQFIKKYREQTYIPYVLHSGDLKEEEGITFLPLYMTPLL